MSVQILQAREKFLKEHCPNVTEKDLESYEDACVKMFNRQFYNHKRKCVRFIKFFATTAYKRTLPCCIYTCSGITEICKKCKKNYSQCCFDLDNERYAFTCCGSKKRWQSIYWRSGLIV